MRRTRRAALAGFATAIMSGGVAAAGHFGDMVTLKQPVIGMLTSDDDGNLYAEIGGVYRTNPNILLLKAASGYAIKKSLHLFTKLDPLGAGPVGGVTRVQGNVLGLTLYGGPNNAGSIFSLGRNSAPAPSVLYPFSGNSIYDPVTGLTAGSHGLAYGVTGGSGAGSVFQTGSDPLSPSLQVIHDFSFYTDGTYPTGGRLALDNDGSLYGLTSYGSVFGGGSLYRLQNVAGTWTETFFSFSSAVGQLHPSFLSNVAVDDKGHAFTCLAGGVYGYGGVVRLSLPAASGTAWHEETLVQFGIHPSDPNAEYGCGLTLDPATGTLIGVSYAGGTYNHGTLFTLTPPATEGGIWTYAIVHNFGGSPLDGFNPSAPVISVGSSFYGSAGAVIFRYTP